MVVVRVRVMGFVLELDLDLGLTFKPGEIHRCA